MNRMILCLIAVVVMATSVVSVPSAAQGKLTFEQVLKADSEKLRPGGSGTAQAPKDGCGVYGCFCKKLSTCKDFGTKGMCTKTQGTNYCACNPGTNPGPCRK